MVSQSVPPRPTSLNTTYSTQSVRFNLDPSAQKGNIDDHHQQHLRLLISVISSSAVKPLIPRWCCRWPGWWWWWRWRRWWCCWWCTGGTTPSRGWISVWWRSACHHHGDCPVVSGGGRGGAEGVRLGHFHLQLFFLYLFIPFYSGFIGISCIGQIIFSRQMDVLVLF